jgi:3-isopropylmalate/(R)-2-methylmalate dehydratase small subunit
VNGLDDIGLTMRYEKDLDAFEAKHDKEFWSTPKANATA